MQWQPLYFEKSNRPMNTTAIYYKARTTGPIIEKVIVATPSNDLAVVETPQASTRTGTAKEP